MKTNNLFLSIILISLFSLIKTNPLISQNQEILEEVEEEVIEEDAIIEVVPDVFSPSSPRRIDNQIVVETFRSNKLKGLRFKENKEIILPAIYNEIRKVNTRSVVFNPGINKSNVCFIVTKDDKSGVVNNFGKTLLDLEYDVITSNYVSKNGKYGIINLKKKVIVPFEYDRIKYLVDPYLSVKKGEKWGLMKTSGKVIISPRYEKIEHDFLEDYIYLHSPKGTVGMYDTYNRKLAFHPTYDKIEKIEKRIKPKKSTFRNFRNDNNPYFKVEKDTKKGIIDLQGDTIINLEYTELEEVLEEESILGFIFKEGDKYGMINPNGDVVYPAKYDNIKYLNQNMFSLEKKNKLALANSTGSILSRFEYERIGYFYQLLQIPDKWKVTEIEKKGKYGSINWKGEVIEKINKPIVRNGYDDVELLFSKFVDALKSDDDLIIKDFCDKISIDSNTIVMMNRLGLDYRGVPSMVFESKTPLNTFTDDFYSRMIKFRDKLKRTDELISLENLGPERLGYGVFDERYDIPATEIFFIMRSDKKNHRVKLGELIKIDGVWKSFTYPKFR